VAGEADRYDPLRETHERVAAEQRITAELEKVRLAERSNYEALRETQRRVAAELEQQRATAKT
jgi:hypothetical protein